MALLTVVLAGAGLLLLGLEGLICLIMAAFLPAAVMAVVGGAVAHPSCIPAAGTRSRPNRFAR